MLVSTRLFVLKLILSNVILECKQEYIIEREREREREREGGGGRDTYYTIVPCYSCMNTF